jgi:hypothetical protein
VALDCEMVEVDRFGEGLARYSIIDMFNNDIYYRVSIVNYNGHVLYDHFVKPEGQITNFRTWVSGVTPLHMKNSKPFKVAK